jgi:hypothetical protein
VQGSDAWSTQALLQAIMILVTFHCLAGMALGVAVTPELDRDGGTRLRPLAAAADTVPTAPAAIAAAAARAARVAGKATNAELVGKLRAMKVSDGGDDAGSGKGASKLASRPAAAAALLDRPGPCRSAHAPPLCGGDLEQFSSVRGNDGREERATHVLVDQRGQPLLRHGRHGARHF